ncbi:hypothetical protein [Paremcibacter congregatus]|uniref:hypothetical protein n=1 Tax=Paremcibacter congregatus TaxID=2043170 RepID=UPI003A937685
MNEYISHLDETYISFSAAAELIAHGQPDISTEEMMVTFKYYLFQGDFECTASDNRHDMKNWLHVPYMPPPGEQAIAEGSTGTLVPAVETRRYYGMNLVSLLSVLICEEALPGPVDAWNNLYDLSQTEQGQKILCRWLALFPFADYPDHGRTLIGEILISREKLKRWLSSRHNIHPDRLLALDRKQDESPRLRLVPPAEATTASPEAANDNVTAEDLSARGRPRKAGWDRIGELVRELHQTESGKLRKVLAYEAYARALNEFPENELPTISSIVRNMSRLLH